MPAIIDATRQKMQKLTTRILMAERLSPDIMRLFLACPATIRANYQSGQYINIHYNDRPRSFSLANAPGQNEHLELHIRRVPDNDFTDYIFEKSSRGDVLEMSGPFGEFAIRQPCEHPLLFVAGGTGFAPIKSFIEYLLAAGNPQAMHLYWGVRTRQDLYLETLAHAWQRHHDIHYTPVLSQPGKADHWTGKQGLVHEVVGAQLNDLSPYEVYISGPPQMIASAHRHFLDLGLTAEHFHTESY